MRSTNSISRRYFTYLVIFLCGYTAIIYFTFEHAAIHCGDTIKASKNNFVIAQKSKWQEIHSLLEQEAPNVQDTDIKGIHDHTPSIIDPSNHLKGVVVLGMHRSGTSLLTGLLTKTGLDVGPSQFLIQPSFDNKLGFFERVDLVLQDDWLMRNQNIDYAHKTSMYDAKQGLKDALDAMFAKDAPSQKFFKEGTRTLAFLNSFKAKGLNTPWMLKDPRLCITLKTWLPLLPSLPAIIFSHRHPLSVAESLHVREHFPLGHGLKMWISYNRAAIRNMDGLCVVKTSNKQLMKEGKKEMDRVVEMLGTKCGVSVPHLIDQKDVDAFIDPSLQHGSTQNDQEDECSNVDLKESQRQKLQTPQVQAIYDEAIRFYCAIEDGSAFKEDFQFPTITDNA